MQSSTNNCLSCLLLSVWQEGNADAGRFQLETALEVLYRQSPHGMDQIAADYHFKLARYHRNSLLTGSRDSMRHNIKYLPCYQQPPVCQWSEAILHEVLFVGQVMLLGGSCLDGYAEVCNQRHNAGQ